jgi:hypothetical protein
MSITNHNAILATTYDLRLTREMEAWINTLLPKWQRLFVKIDSGMNKFQTIIMAPDGSAESWQTSVDAAEIRKSFIEQLEKCKFADGTSAWRWVEIGFGEYGQRILQGNNKNVHNNDEYAIKIDESEPLLYLENQ